MWGGEWFPPFQVLPAAEQRLCRTVWVPRLGMHGLAWWEDAAAGQSVGSKLRRPVGGMDSMMLRHSCQFSTETAFAIAISFRKKSR